MCDSKRPRPTPRCASGHWCAPAAVVDPCPAPWLRALLQRTAGEFLLSLHASFPQYLLRLFVYLGFFLFLPVIHFLHHFSPGEGQKGLIFVRFVKVFLCLWEESGRIEKQVLL